MKAMKKMLAVLVSVMMALGMMTTAFAAEGDPVITLPDNNHTYAVYQIMTGDLAVVNGDKVLSNVQWGSNATKSGEVSEEDMAAVAAINGTDAEKASKVAKYVDLSSDPVATLNNDSVSVPTGYYLIKDLGVKGEDGKYTLPEGEAYSLYVIQVVSSTTIAPKAETVTSDKKEYNDDVKLTDKNEAGVGAVVSYDITAKIADDAGSYDYYFFVLNDKLSAGLTFNNDIVVTIGGEAATENVDYKVYLNEDGYTFQVALLNAKAHAGKTVKVNYSATVNDKAVTTNPETNDFTVTYSRDPNHDYDGDKTPDDGPDSKPGKPADSTTDAFGKTPESVTKTYTCEIDLTKRADSENGDVLPGAVFQLTSADANQTVITSHDYYAVDENGTFYKLKDGTYTETAPVADTYKAIGTGDENTTVGYILVDDNYIVPTDTKDYAGKTVYEFVKGNLDLYADTSKYAVKTETTDESVVSPVDMTMTTDENGMIKFQDLGAGTYILTEIKAPDGYNLAAPVTITITFDEATEKFIVDTTALTDGIYATTIVDEKGTVLPETGGMGTTLFYAVGGLMVVVAGVLLITKKRMNG